MSDAQIPTRSKRGLDLNVAAELGDLLHELSADRKFRGRLGKIIKEAKPESPHAQAFADVDLEDRFDAFKREQEENKIKDAQDAAVARMNAQRNSLLTGGADGSGRKYAEDDIKKIEALMEKKGITDYEDGATLYAATLPPVTMPENDVPGIQHGATWEFPEWAKFGDDPVRASRQVAHDVITELRRTQRA